jgi:hypothetical protein
MIGSKEFFEELRHGDEYLSCFMTREVYSGIEFELRERIGVTTIRQKNDNFDSDDTHKQLRSNIHKAKTELLKYEFNINHK